MLNLLNLTEDVRASMLDELRRDISQELVYISPRLTERGASEWPALLESAIREYDDRWLAQQLVTRNLIKSQEQRRRRNGGYSLAKVPYTAPETLSEGEFNRYFIRGVCSHVLESGGTEVEVYRAKHVSDPRIRSVQLIGQLVSAGEVLDDLRKNDPEKPMLGIPGGPNSGISVRIPE